MDSELSPTPTKTIEAAIRVPAASLELVQMEIPHTVHSVLREETSLRLDLTLNPRLPTRASFPDRWAAHRYEMPGRTFVLPPGIDMRIRGEAGVQQAIICHIPVSSIETWLEGDIQWSDRQLEASLDIASPTIENLLLQLSSEARNPGMASEVLSEAIAVQIAIHLHRHLTGIEEGTTGGGLAAWRLRTIDERLQDLAEAPTLGELAGLCRMSVRQLSRAFYDSRGMSIGAYVTFKRLEQAKIILAQREPVKRVAYLMGFASPSAFCYAFRKGTGFSPGEYQQSVLH